MALILFLLFLLVPILELAVILRVGQVIGAWWTLAALVSASVAGAALVKREGRGTWRRFRAALDAGHLPAEEVVDGALLLVGGVLMLTPGFITDIVGLLLAAPPSRRFVNRA
ncbi:MAG: FxsA family protein, partial [Actinomycetota bacterium]|nr:FxsA family protein [Actinomycetota bacterium]